MAQLLMLSGEPDAVPAVRRYVRDRLHGTSLEHRVDDAELIVTELVTNATLYGIPPVTVEVQVLDRLARLEVHDGSPSGPVRPVRVLDAMTGRGLLLVEAVSDRWGVERVAGGKYVWAEIDVESPPADGHTAETDASRVPDAALDELVERLGDERFPGGGQRFPIKLGDVPTDLLLAAKAHVDNLLREFALVTRGAASGQSAAVSQHLTELIETVTTGFAEAREGIKRQALAAVAAGRERTDLDLRLPVGAIEAGRRYLAALDEVDAYARAARLLTLETPPQHRAFRHWYVSSLISQLQAYQAGTEPPPPVPFEQFLLDELEVVATAQRAADRSARLQQVTASLAGATSIQEVAGIVVSQGVDALGASGGALLVPASGESFTVLASVNYGDRLLDELRTGGVGARLPAAQAMRTGRPVWVESREQRDAMFPDLHLMEPTIVSMAAVPLALAGRVLAVLRLSFDSPRLFDDEERAFVQAFVAQTVQALARCELYTAERRARAEAETAAGRLSRLNRVTASLAAASDVQQIAEIVAVEAHTTLGATISALCLVEDRDIMRVVELRGATTGTRERWASFPVSANLPASEAVRTNQPVVMRSRDEMAARYPALAGQSPRELSGVCVPLSAGGRALGALSLSFPPGVVDDEVVELLMTIGRQCALALERAHLMAAEREARERSSFLADGTARLTSSLEPEETLRHLTELTVPMLADWSVVYLADEAGHLTAAAAQHRDPEATGLLRLLQDEHRLGGEPGGVVAEVLRTGRAVTYSRTCDELEEEFVRLLGNGEQARALQPSSALVVPLARRDRVLGALVLARLNGTTYTDEDAVLASELAARAAVALDNAARFRREREVALTLQRSLLPQVLPKVPGLALAWRYFPGAAGTHVGGDWYDIIPLEHGRVALVIGDVMGRGLQAAAVMGQLRATARAHVAGDLGPGEVLSRIDTELMWLEQEQIATVLLLLLDPATGTMTAASAGHLPPLVRTAEGEVRYLEVAPGPPLGTGSGSYAELEVDLPQGATVLLYTDGLVEDRALSAEEGMATLAAAVVDAREPELLCDLALAALGRDVAHDDDTAMLAVLYGEP